MSFFGTLRRVRKGRKPAEHSLRETSLRAQGLQQSLGSCYSTPNLLGQILEDPPTTPKLGSPASTRNTLKVERDTCSLSSTLYSSDGDDGGVSGGESLESCSVSSEANSGGAGYLRPAGPTSISLRHNSHSFRQGATTKFVAHAAEMLEPLKGSAPARIDSAGLDRGKHFPHGKGSHRRRSSGDFTADGPKYQLTKSSSVQSLAPKSEAQRKEEILMITGVKRFNWDPKKGVEFFTKNGIIGDTASDVARLLKNCQHLSRHAVGTYLGEYDEFCQEVLHHFVSLFNFKGVHLVEAMRRFLASFRLPGEAQKIDRIIESFAHLYCDQNPEVFSNTDACYLLSYAIIMLNTTLHNPSVKSKPTAEQFVAMNRGIDFGDSVDPPFLISIYNAIRSEEFQVPAEEGATDLKLIFCNPDLKDWLWKRGENNKSWKRRWFVLNDNCLYYFKQPEDKRPRAIIPLENIQACEGPAHAKYYLFLLRKPSVTNGTEFIKSCKRLSDGSMVLGRHSEFILGAVDRETRDTWVEAITHNGSFHEYYSLVQEKKRNILALQQKATVRTKKMTAKKSHIRKSQISLPTCRPEGDMSFIQQQSLDEDVEEGAPLRSSMSSSIYSYSEEMGSQGNSPDAVSVVSTTEEMTEPIQGDHDTKSEDENVAAAGAGRESIHMEQPLTSEAPDTTKIYLSTPIVEVDDQFETKGIAGKISSVNEGTGIPAVNEGKGVPAVNEGTGIPAVNEGTGIPPVNKGTGIPPVNKGTRIPPVNKGTGIPVLDEGTGKPAMNEGTGIPAMNEGTGIPAVNEGAGMPAMQHVHTESSSSDSESPQCELATVQVPLGKLCETQLKIDDGTTEGKADDGNQVFRISTEKPPGLVSVTFSEGKVEATHGNTLTDVQDEVNLPVIHVQKVNDSSEADRKENIQSD